MYSPVCAPIKSLSSYGKSVSMSHPTLTWLHIAGLKIYNSADLMDLILIEQITDIIPHDVILNDGIAIVITSEGLYQYDYSDVDNIKIVSEILL